MRENSKAGFTLVELLITATLGAMIAFAVFANLSAGIRLWASIIQPAGLEDVNIFYNKLTRDFYGVQYYASIPFEGNDKGVVFAGFIEADPALGGDRGIGEIRYTFDPGKRALLRAERNISEVANDRAVAAQTVFGPVGACRISYFAFVKEEDTYRWTDVWEDKADQVPTAIRFELELAGPLRGETLVKTLLIPTSGIYEKQ